MICLLLLRGWVGNVMATEMAASESRHVQIATENIADNAYLETATSKLAHILGDMPTAAATPDCADHSKSGPATELGDTSCQSCSACQACHSLALSTFVGSADFVSMSPDMPRSPAAQFVSAVAALGQKPPIS